MCHRYSFSTEPQTYEWACLFRCRERPDSSHSYSYCAEYRHAKLRINLEAEFPRSSPARFRVDNVQCL